MAAGPKGGHAKIRKDMEKQLEKVAQATGLWRTLADGPCPSKEQHS